MFTVIKNDVKANELAMRSIKLGLSLQSRNVMAEKWCMKVKDIAEQIRLKRLALENSSAENEFLQFKNKNEALIAELVLQAKQEYKDFIKFIREKYAYSEMPDFNINQLDESNKMKIIIKMIRAYHPDNQVRSNAEETKIYFIKQEITKHLNAYYNECKQKESANENENESANESSSGCNTEASTKKSKDKSP